MAVTEEILGQFLGDESFPVTWDAEVEKDFFWVYDDLHCPAPGQPDVLRHRRLVAQLRPHVPPVRDAVRGRLARQERQRLRLHDRDPGRSRPPHRRDRVQRPLRRPGAARRGVRHDDGRVPRHGPAGLRPGLRRLVARPAAAGDGAQLRVPRGASRRRRRDGPGRRGLPPRGRDRHPRSPLEDPLDAQLRPAVGDAQPARGHGEDARRGRRGAAGAAPELGLGPQLGLDRGAVADEERGPRRRRAAGGVRVRGRRARSPPRCAASERGRRFIAERVEPYQREFGWHAVWSHEFIFPTVREQMEPVLELVRGYLDDATTTSRPRSRRCAATSRRRRARSSTG